MVDHARSRRHAFTLLEVALIVAIIGMMLMMVVGYLFAPKPRATSGAPVSPRPIMTPAPPAPPATVPAPFTTIRPEPPDAAPAPPDAATPAPKPQFR